jgi:hypothetical protein
MIYNLSIKDETINDPFNLENIQSIRDFMNQISSFSIIGKNLTFKTFY